MRWVIALLACTVMTTARADTESARDHYDKGLSAYALGRFKDAALEYEAAFDLKPDPALLYNAAQAHRLAGNKERALFLYENYLRLFPSRPNEKDVHRHIVALKAAIESDAQAKSSPPVEPLNAAPSPAPHKTEPPPVITTAPLARETTLTASAPAPKKTRRWVWGVVGGVAGVVVIGVAVGLAVGLSGSSYPHPGIGTVTLQ